MVVYIINGIVTINKLDNGPRRAYFMEYVTTTGLILYGYTKQSFISTEIIIIGLINIILMSPQNTITLPIIYFFNNILKVLFMIRI